MLKFCSSTKFKYETFPHLIVRLTFNVLKIQGVPEEQHLTIPNNAFFFESFVTLCLLYRLYFLQSLDEWCKKYSKIVIK